MKITVIGGGNMGHTFAHSMKNGLGNAEVGIVEIYPPRLKELREENVFKLYTDPSKGINDADIIFLAVKPQQASELFAKINKHINKDQLIISIMAGTTIDFISKKLHTNKVVRAMPNLPAQIGKGMTVFVLSEDITEVEKSICTQILNSSGLAFEVPNEQMIDAGTGIAGSGPAYVFYFMRAMIAAAQEMGFSSEEAKTLVLQTFEGAVSLYQCYDYSTDEWIKRVASKGGTTRAALDSFDNDQCNDIIKKGAFAAFYRAIELGK